MTKKVYMTKKEQQPEPENRPVPHLLNLVSQLVRIQVLTKLLGWEKPVVVKVMYVDLNLGMVTLQNKEGRFFIFPVDKLMFEVK